MNAAVVCNKIREAMAPCKLYLEALEWQHWGAQS
jgi:hypothetical protein